MAIALPNNITHQAFGRLRLSSMLDNGPHLLDLRSVLAFLDRHLAASRTPRAYTAMASGTPHRSRRLTSINAADCQSIIPIRAEETYRIHSPQVWGTMFQGRAAALMKAYYLKEFMNEALLPPEFLFEIGNCRHGRNRAEGYDLSA